MNWEAIGALAEMLGAVGVIASLIYLAGQVRGGAHQARQAAVLSVADKSNRVFESLSSNGEEADVWVRGSKGLAHLVDEAEVVRFSYFLFTVMKPYEELFYYRRKGGADEWVWQTLVPSVSAVMSTPGSVEWWESCHTWFSDEFQEYVRETLGTGPDYERFPPRPNDGDGQAR